MVARKKGEPKLALMRVRLASRGLICRGDEAGFGGVPPGELAVGIQFCIEQRAGGDDGEEREHEHHRINAEALLLHGAVVSGCWWQRDLLCERGLA